MPRLTRPKASNAGPSRFPSPLIIGRAESYDRMNRVPRSVKISALLLAIVVGFYWRITLTRQYDWMWSPDHAGQVLPWFQAEARQWHQRGFPMWDQYLWGGQPLFGQAQPGAAYPLNWLLFWMPFNRLGHISIDALD